MKNRFTIVLNDHCSNYKLIKVIIGKDGSIMITSPYFEARSVIAFKATINYANDEMDVSLQQTISSADMEDDSKCLKMTHHPSGFIHFSGAGILSGKDEDGNPKGIGVQSYPLSSPVAGPAMGVTIYGYKEFDSLTKVNDESIIMPLAIAEDDKLNVELFFFEKKDALEHIRTINSKHFAGIEHPIKGQILLRILSIDQEDNCPVVIGIHMYNEKGMEDQNIPSFFMSSSTGNIRENDRGELLGDGIFCMFPKQNFGGNFRLNFPSD